MDEMIRWETGDGVELADIDVQGGGCGIFWLFSFFCFFLFESFCALEFFLCFALLFLKLLSSTVHVGMD